MEKASAENDERTLELTGEQFKGLIAQVTELLAQFLDTLPDQPAANLAGAAEAARRFLGPPPEESRPFDEILHELFTTVFPIALNTTGPGYLAYVPGGGLPQAAIADLMALVTNRFAGLWAAGPIAATIEFAVIRWFCELVGYGTDAGGFLTSGGSIANWAAVVAARELRMPQDFHRGVIYTSSQSHHSVDKAAIMAGIRRENVRHVAVDADYQMRIDSLEDAIRRDRGQGLVPLLIVAQAGSTNTGAVDNLEAIAEVAHASQAWMHVDAAYGGFFLLTDGGRKALRGIDLADSVTLDPHKGLFLPYGTGCLLVRRREPLRQVFGIRAEYMTAAVESPEFVDFCDISPELSRDFRGLRVWLPLQMHGAGAFRQCLTEKLALTRYVEEELQKIPSLELVARSPLSIVAFRMRKPDWDESETNEQNRRFLQRINGAGRVWLTPTTLDGRFVIRICILSFRTHRDRIDECLAIIRSSL